MKVPGCMVSHPYRSERHGCRQHGQPTDSVCRRCGSAMCDECHGWLDGCDRCAAHARRRARWLRRAVVAALSLGGIALGVAVVHASHDEMRVDFGGYTTATVRENARALRERPCDLEALSALAVELRNNGGCAAALPVVEAAERRCPELLSDSGDDIARTLGIAIDCHLAGNARTLPAELAAPGAPQSFERDVAIAEWHASEGRTDQAHEMFHSLAAKLSRHLDGAKPVLRVAKGLQHTSGDLCHTVPILTRACQHLPRGCVVGISLDTLRREASSCRALETLITRTRERCG
jgi:hypothetical protein